MVGSTSGGAWDGTWRNTGCRLTVDMTLAGYRAVVLENRWLRVTLLADKGGDVIEFLYKPLDVDAMFRRPGGLRHPSRWIPSNASAHGHFFDSYAGGWQLIFPAAGPPSGYAGAEFGQHGEPCLLPFAVDGGGWATGRGGHAASPHAADTVSRGAALPAG